MLVQSRGWLLSPGAGAIALDLRRRAKGVRATRREAVQKRLLGCCGESADALSAQWADRHRNARSPAVQLFAAELVSGCRNRPPLVRRPSFVPQTRNARWALRLDRCRPVMVVIRRDKGRMSLRIWRVLREELP